MGGEQILRIKTLDRVSPFLDLPIGACFRATQRNNDSLWIKITEDGGVSIMPIAGIFTSWRGDERLEVCSVVETSEIFGVAEWIRERKPIEMLLWCPECRARHVDLGEFETKPHHTHACQSCGHVWRPAIVPTVGVQFLPGLKNED